MARPNNSAAIGGYVQGLREAKAAFERVPEVLREELNDATELTVKDIVSLARSKIISSPSIRTRTLLNAIGWSLNKKSGRGRAGIMTVTTTISNPTIGGTGRSTVKVKGILVAGKGGSALRAKGARLIDPRKYGPKVEFGTRKMKAEPFMIPAADQSKSQFLDRCQVAGRQAEKRLAIGGES